MTDDANPTDTDTPQTLPCLPRLRRGKAFFEADSMARLGLHIQLGENRGAEAFRIAGRTVCGACGVVLPPGAIVSAVGTNRRCHSADDGECVGAVGG